MDWTGLDRMVSGEVRSFHKANEWTSFAGEEPLHTKC